MNALVDDPVTIMMIQGFPVLHRGSKVNRTRGARIPPGIVDQDHGAILLRRHHTVRSLERALADTHTHRLLMNHTQLSRAQVGPLTLGIPTTIIVSFAGYFPTSTTG